jgi:hypothetical protein
MARHALEDGRISGSLADTSIAELLAETYNLAFTGVLELWPEGEGRAAIDFENGAVRDARGPWESGELERERFNSVLPPDLLDLAEQHSEQYQVGLVEAVERLKLLPPGGLAAVREARVQHCVRAACQFGASTRYAFSPQAVADTATRLASPLEPIQLIASSALADPRSERLAAVVRGFSDGELSLDPLGARSLLALISGPVRPLVESLSQAPKTLAQLEQSHALGREFAHAGAYALWLTHHLRVRAPEAAAPAARVTQTLPPQTRPVPSGPAFSGVPPKREPTRSQSPAPVTSPHEQLVKERLLEDKVAEAWSLAQSDPASVERMTAFVRKATGVFPSNTRILCFSARLLEYQGLVTEAMHEYERVLAIEPGHDEARAALGKLRQSLSPQSVGDRLKRLFTKN